MCDGLLCHAVRRGDATASREKTPPARSEYLRKTGLTTGHSIGEMSTSLPWAGIASGRFVFF